MLYYENGKLHKCEMIHERRMHTNHFGNISKFFKINGQLLEVGRRSVDISRMHEFIHRHFRLFPLIQMEMLTFCAPLQSICMQRFSSLECTC